MVTRVIPAQPGQLASLESPGCAREIQRILAHPEQQGQPEQLERPGQQEVCATNIFFFLCC